MTPKKPARQRRIEGGTPKKGAVSHRPAPESADGLHFPADGSRLPPENGGLSTNGHILEELMSTRALIRHLTELVAAEGPFSIGSVGQRRRNPNLISLERASARAAQLERRLGLVKAAEPAEEDGPPLAEVLFEALGPNPRAGAVDWCPATRAPRIFP